MSKSQSRGCMNTKVIVALISGIFVLVAALITGASTLGVPFVEQMLDGTPAESIVPQGNVQLDNEMSSSNGDAETNEIGDEVTSTSQDNEATSGVGTIAPGDTLTDKVAADAHDDYTFQGTSNTPVIISGERTDGDLLYRVAVLDSEGEALERSPNSDSTVEFPFTPPEDGTYIIRVIGVREFGEYSVSMRWVDESPEAENPLGQFSAGSQTMGYVAADAHDDYTFQGTSNTPVIISGERTDGDLLYRVAVLDSEGEALERSPNSDSTVEFPFTPPEDGTYIIRVIGVREFGEYSLGMEALE